MDYIVFSDKIIKNVFENLESDLYRNGFLVRRDEFDLRILLELILFIRSLDKIKGDYFCKTYNKFHFPIYAFKFYPFEFFTHDIGLMQTHQVKIEGENRKVKIFESTANVELFYRLLGESLKNERLEASHEKLNLTLKHRKEQVETYTLSAHFFTAKLEDMPVQDLWDLNEFLKQFKAHEAYAKGKNDENKAIKKFRDYCDYFDAVVNLNKKSFVFNIEFLIQGQNKLNDHTFTTFKREFMNAMRGFRQLSQISGYMGFWDLDHQNGLCFRILFCVPDLGIEVAEWVEDIIYYWENIYFSKVSKEYGFNQYDAIRFDAQVIPIAVSDKKLNNHFLSVTKHNKSLKKLICEHAISYIVLSEFYYCPVELQLYLKSVALILAEQSEQEIEEETAVKRMFKVFRGSVSKKEL
ncbi:hypothetical protein KTJ20_08110 [Acinetobacter ursingii]|uniref:hypothetical protein n=2 Tax=Acinetobacter ursingii TaxID=108980 RepID=UPI00124E592B|nr:hypothetical protein [Acinetobacter ursingii]MCU4588719.1 hypothetical protein [Acinetobacter ursingii]